MVYTFIPALYYLPIQGSELTNATNRFFGHYRGIPTPYVVIIASGVATPTPGENAPTLSQLAVADAGSGRNGRAIFVGGVAYTVTAGEKTILEAAGYSVTS